MPRRSIVFVVLFILSTAFVVLGASAMIASRVAATPAPSLVVATSPVVVDRDGRLLRAFTVADGRWRLPVDSADVDPLLIELLLAFEDRRFYAHAGVDPRALVRAAM